MASALAQDYTNLEVVVMDDASTDGTADVAEAFGDDRLRVVRSDRRSGMAGNWSRSVKASRGDYVKLLMQDDSLEPSCVSSMAGVLSRNPSVGLVFAPRTIRVEDPDDVLSRRLARKLERRATRLGSLREANDGRAIFEAIRKSGLRANWVGEPTAVMARRTALRRVGLFNPRLRQLTDLELWLRLAWFFDVGYVPETLSTFTLHATAETSSNLWTGSAWLDAAWVLEGLRAYPEIRAHLGSGTEVRVWAGIAIAEASRYWKTRLRAGHAYRRSLREFVRYRRHPSGDLHPSLDDDSASR